MRSPFASLQLPMRRGEFYAVARATFRVLAELSNLEDAARASVSNEETGKPSVGRFRNIRAVEAVTSHVAGRSASMAPGERKDTALGKNHGDTCA